MFQQFKLSSKANKEKKTHYTQKTNAVKKSAIQHILFLIAILTIHCKWKSKLPKFSAQVRLSEDSTCSCRQRSAMSFQNDE